MFHYFSRVETGAGDSLVDWQVEVVELADGETVVPIYSDENSTAIETVSGITNRAKTDSLGNYDLFVADGTYSLRFYNENGVFQRTQRYLPMYGTGMAGVDADRAEAAATAAETAETNAETAETGAEAAQAAAETAQTNAETAETNAETAETNAETAEAAAVVASLASGNVYHDTTIAAAITAAEAALTTGDEFFAFGDDANYIAIHEMDTASTSVEFGQLSLGTATVDQLLVENSSHWKFGIRDGSGNVIMGVDANGKLVADFSLVPDAFQTGNLYDFNLNGVANYGQSYAVGTQAYPAESTIAAYDHKMFYRGMRPEYDYPGETGTTWYQSLVSAVEMVSPTSALVGETGMCGFGDGLKELILAEDGKAYTDHDYQLLLSAPAEGGKSINELSKGGSYYSRLTDQWDEALTLANAAGDTFGVQVVFWTQGQQDYFNGSQTQAQYLALLTTLCSDIDTDAKAITSQTKDIMVIGNQVADHPNYSRTTPWIALAQLEAHDTLDNFILAGPEYPVERSSDNLHPTLYGYHQMAALRAYVYKKVIINEETWEPLRPVSQIVQDDLLVVRFNVPKGELIFDTTLVPAQTTQGFELEESDGTPITISSVEISDYDTVKITAAATIPAGAVLKYGWTDTNGYQGMGNLRDTMGDTVIYQPDYYNIPVHNWCCVFERTIS